MKKTLIILFFLYANHSIILGQTSFNAKIKDLPSELLRNADEDKIFELSISSNISVDPIFLDYKVKVVAVPERCSLPLTEFEVDFKEIALSQLVDGHKFYIKLMANTAIDKQREIFLDLKITSSIDPTLARIKNVESNPGTLVKIGLKTESLKNYDYLAYVGTNFDLVDGVKASNLYFATHLFKLPKIKSNGKKSSNGFSLLLYGNRTYSYSSSRTEEVMNSSVRRMTSDSVTYLVEKGKAEISDKIVTDNIGFSYAPIVPINVFGDYSERIVKVYWAPQVEWVWRRSNSSTTIGNFVKDTSEILTVRNGILPPMRTVVASSFSYNTYDFMFNPISLFLVHENEHISVRLQPSFLALAVSYTNLTSQRNNSAVRYQVEPSYTSKFNIVYGARLWITEPVTGITLGGDFSFRLKHGVNPFFNVTLSKALSYKNISTILAPIVPKAP